MSPRRMQDLCAENCLNLTVFLASAKRITTLVMFQQMTRRRAQAVQLGAHANSIAYTRVARLQ
jgi:hypothetical protein